MKESNQVIFRNALDDDYNVLLTLRNELHKKHAKAEPGFYKDVEVAISKQDFYELVDKEEVFVLEKDKSMVGYVIVKELKVQNDPLIHDQHILFVDDFYIAPNYIGNGLGRKMFNHIVEYGKEKGCSSIELNVWNFNEEAKQFYSKMDMKVTRIRMKKVI